MPVIDNTYPLGSEFYFKQEVKILEEKFAYLCRLASDRDIIQDWCDFVSKQSDQNKYFEAYKIALKAMSNIDSCLKNVLDRSCMVNNKYSIPMMQRMWNMHNASLFESKKKTKKRAQID